MYQDLQLSSIELLSSQSPADTDTHNCSTHMQDFFSVELSEIPFKTLLPPVCVSLKNILALKNVSFFFPILVKLIESFLCPNIHIYYVLLIKMFDSIGSNITL